MFTVCLYAKTATQARISAACTPLAHARAPILNDQLGASTRGHN
jgi:hypothetical protein